MKKTGVRLAKKASFLPIAFVLRGFRFLFRNIVDFTSVIWPLPSKKHTGGVRYLIFNWRDTKHSYAGGAELYIYEMAKRWVKKGNDVTIFCGNDGNNSRYEIVDGIEVIRRGGFYFVYVWAFIYYLVKFRGRYDVIIDCENGIPFFTPLYAKEKIYLLIHHVHQEVFRKSLTPPFSWLASYLEIQIMPYVYKNVQVVTVSESSKKDIEDYGLSKRPAIVLHNGVDLNKYKPATKNPHPMMLYVGRLKYYKSVHIFIQAAKVILEKFPDTEVIIAGSGEEDDNLYSLCCKLKIDKIVKFMGKVSEAKKIELYQKAWVFVQPSFMEGWGSTNIEANACGTPVVASNVPGLRDSVRNPSSGFLVPYGQTKEFADKVALLITDEKMRQYMSEKSIEWAQNFDWNKTAQEGLEIFSR